MRSYNYIIVDLYTGREPFLPGGSQLHLVLYEWGVTDAKVLRLGESLSPRR